MRFFSWMLCGRLPLFFQSSVFLRFFSRRVFRKELACVGSATVDAVHSKCDFPPFGGLFFQLGVFFPKPIL